VERSRDHFTLKAAHDAFPYSAGLLVKMNAVMDSLCLCVQGIGMFLLWRQAEKVQRQVQGDQKVLVHLMITVHKKHGQIF
jgi:hypothetical protein